MKTLFKAFLFGISFYISSAIVKYCIGDSIVVATEIFLTDFSAWLQVLALITVTTLQGLFLLWIFRTFFQEAKAND